MPSNITVLEGRGGRGIALEQERKRCASCCASSAENRRAFDHTGVERYMTPLNSTVLDGRGGRGTALEQERN